MPGPEHDASKTPGKPQDGPGTSPPSAAETDSDTDPRPRLFISATSGDLRKAREVVQDALLKRRCDIEVQENFATASGNVAAVEARLISQCDGLIHLAGRVYGEEPKAPGKDEPRRSYTQREYHCARRLGRPAYVFLATDAFYQDAANLPEGRLPQEPADKQNLQQAHCLQLRAQDNLWFEFSSLEQLRELVLRLNASDEKWQKMLTAARRRHLQEHRHYLWIAGGIFLGIALILGMLWGMHQNHQQDVVTRDIQHQAAMEQERLQHKQTLAQMQKTEERLQRMEEFFQAQVAAAPQGSLRPGQALDQALKSTAQEEGVPEGEIKKDLPAFVERVDTDPEATEDQKRLANLARKFVLRGFTREEFEGYVQSIIFKDWKPGVLVLHHTAAPTLAQLPGGFTETRLRNIMTYFTGQMNWNGGPHLFIDRERIWIFNTLTEPGIHTPAWNKTGLGIEMLGDYDTEPLDERVRDNTVWAMAVLSRKLGLGPADLRLHREDPKTRQNCPGKNVSKEDMMSRLAVELGR